MKKFTYMLLGLNTITLAAHCSRAGLGLLSILVLLIPFVLFHKNKISIQIVQVFMVLAGAEWIRTTLHFVSQRMDTGEPWLRLAIILWIVVVAAFGSAFLLNGGQFKDIYK